MQKINKAVISAAGRGTRQYPATNTIQKELIPLVDTDGFTKPALQIIVEEALASGIEEICIVANPQNAGAIRAHFQGLSADQRRQYAEKPAILNQSDRLAEIQSRLTVVIQQTQEGYGHAVYQAREFVGGDPFLLLLGDHIYLTSGERCAWQVLSQSELFDAPLASVVPVDEKHVSRYGIVAVEPIAGHSRASKIVRMCEKPTVDFARRELRSATAGDSLYYAFFGMYCLPPAIFDYLKYLIDHDLRSHQEIQFTAAQELLLRDSPLYIALTVEGKRYDIGVPDGLIETQVALALNSPYASHVQQTLQEVERLKLTHVDGD